MKKQTVITIEFEGEIPQPKLDQLIGEIAATCSEDSEGKGWNDGKVVTYHRVDTLELELTTNKKPTRFLHETSLLVTILKNQTVVEAFEFFIDGSDLLLENKEDQINHGTFHDRFTYRKKFHDPAELYKVALRTQIHPDNRLFIDVLNEYNLKDEFIDEFQPLITLNL